MNTLSLNDLARECHDTAVRSGFYDRDSDNPLTQPVDRVILRHMLIITEVAELTEAIRKPELSNHIPSHTLEEEEVADILIRVLDYAAWRGIDLTKVMNAKMTFNQSREHMHGKKV